MEGWKRWGITKGNMAILATAIDKNKNKLVFLLKKRARVSLKSLSFLSNL
jgi:hypothetical protein